MVNNKFIKMKLALLVFILLSIVIIGNEGVDYTVPSNIQSLEFQLDTTKIKNLLLIDKIGHKLTKYELSPKAMDEGQAQ